jgi:hypothetical protein
MNALTTGLFGFTMTLALAACGSSSGGAGGSGSTGDAQTPAHGAANVPAWLAKGDYKSWSCETAVHAARSPSPHGFNRICSNTAISSNAAGTGAWPVGAAAVKELYATMTDTTPGGYAVYHKTADDTSAGGTVWYWYEQPVGTSVFADGLGDSGNPQTVCVACHSLSGSDTAHTPSPNGHDNVYTPVQ